MGSAKYIWSDGDLIPWDEAKVHFLAHALQYGSGVFEGIRAYDTPEGTAVFRLGDHMVRLEGSAKAYGIPMRWSADELTKATLELLRACELRSAYIRPLVFYGTGNVGLNPTGYEVQTMMAAFPLGTYLGDEGMRKGVTSIISTWRRVSQSAFIPTAKGSGQYLNSILAKQEAVRAGYDEAIMLNEHGTVSEGTGMNIFVVSRGAVRTPPVSSGILEGITRASVMELLAENGVSVEEEVIPRGGLYTADEVFLTGTAAEVTPIREIDGRTIGSGEPGPVTRQAQDLYRDAVNGKLAGHRDWLDFV